mgnify:FL=1
MKYYLYDFDGTIYDGDSSVDFFKFCLKKDKSIYKMLPKMFIKFIAYKSKNITDTELKEYIFSFLKKFKNIDSLIDEFWQTHKSKIKKFYLEKKHDNDIIISASPEFLLKPICKELGVRDLIASDVNKKTGKFNKPNNRGEAKVKVFYEKYPNAAILEMYSDSMHDKPLLDIAKKSYFVKKDKIFDYETYKPNLIKRFWNWGWGIYHKNEELWNYLIVGGLTTVVSVGSYAIFSKILKIDYLISNILSWGLSVVFAYFTNRWFVFHSKNKNKINEFLKFTGSRVLTLLLDSGLMVLGVEYLKIDDLLTKILVQIIIVISNYIISKLIVFKKEKK